MKAVSHDSKLSPYPHEPGRVDLIQLPLVLVGWTVECLGGKILPIAHLDEPENFTIRTFSNPVVLVVDRPFAGSRGFTRCLSHWFAVQAKPLDARNFLLALLGGFLELSSEHSQVVNVLGVCSFVVGEFDLEGKAT